MEGEPPSSLSLNAGCPITRPTTPAKNQNPGPGDGQVHPTARSEYLHNRFVNGFHSRLQPPVTPSAALSPILGKMATLQMWEATIFIQESYQDVWYTTGPS